jgi:ribosomal protein L11 methyltransferase
VRAEYDVVVANIEARVLVDLATEIASRTRRPGVLVLSGVLSTQKDDVTRAFRDFDRTSAKASGEWVAVVLERL